MFFPSVIGFLMLIRSKILPLFFLESEFCALADKTPRRLVYEVKGGEDEDVVGGGGDDRFFVRGRRFGNAAAELYT